MFKITFLIAIVGMNLITLTLTLNSAAVVFAQIDSSTNSTCSSESNNQTGIEPKPFLPLPKDSPLYKAYIDVVNRQNSNC
jgi:hypothetical protein